MQSGKEINTTETSSRYRFFTWVVLFLAISQLLIGIDYITIWPGAETEHIWQSMDRGSKQSLSSVLMGLFPVSSPYWLLFYRLPSVLFYIATIYLFYRWGKTLFGQEFVQLVLVVLGGSIFLPIIAKMASIDSWTLFFEIATWLSILHFQKDPSKKWLLRIAIFGSLAVLFGQVQSVLLMLIWQVLYYRLSGPQNETVKSHLARPFVIIYLVFAISLFFSGHSSSSSYYFNFIDLQYHHFLLFSLLGVAPFIGFCMASFRDLVYKLKRGEELSKILAIGLLGSFLTQSLVFPFLLVFMTAKQLQHYFKEPNYPWQNWVKTWQILHLIIVFIGVIVALIGGFASFQTDGFRAVLGCSAAYWMFSFVGVIGLYGFKRDYVLGGMTLAGALALLFFWVQVYPFLHLKRNWPERMVIKIERLEDNQKAIRIDSKRNSACLQIAPYLKKAGKEVLISKMPTSTSYAIRKKSVQDSTRIYDIEVEGWSGLWKEGVWVIK